MPPPSGQSTDLPIHSQSSQPLVPSPSTALPPNNALLLAISGPSSSGKTTLSRLLRDIYPNTFLLHQDDFYLPDAQIPLTHSPTSNSNIQNWDCVEALDITSMISTLEYIRRNGMLPREFVSKEDKNSVGDVPVREAVVEELGWRAAKWQFADLPPIWIVDGFLLLGESVRRRGLHEMFDLKVFLRCGKDVMRGRREGRQGYVTLEGFWEDPKGYVEEVVWPGYVEEHRGLFVGGDVEGELDEGRTRDLGIEGMSESCEGDMEGMLRWAFEIVERGLEERVRKGRREE